MSLEDLGLIDYKIVDKTLLIDGDIVIYQPCCIFNEDDDMSRRQIAKYVNKKIEDLMAAADCNKYIMFVTTKFNFRDHIVDDYKANRADVDRPVNLAWAKQWATKNLNTHYEKWLEADDLLGIYQTKDTVIWSLDKDLRQVPGDHLDDATMKVVNITTNGTLRKEVIMKECGKRIKKTKYHFTGDIGLYFQMLTGDSTDWIVGCGKREMVKVKSGKDKGRSKLKRVGVGPGGAYDMLVGLTNIEHAVPMIMDEYAKVHGKDWKMHLENNANLLFMVRERQGSIVKRWTCDGRDEFMDVTDGSFVDGFGN